MATSPWKAHGWCWQEQNPIVGKDVCCNKAFGTASLCSVMPSPWTGKNLHASIFLIYLKDCLIVL